MAKARSVGFKMKRVSQGCSIGIYNKCSRRFQHDAFTVMFDEIADEACVLPENLIVTYDGARVFASATPHSLKIWDSAEMGLSTSPSSQVMMYSLNYQMRQTR